MKKYLPLVVFLFLSMLGGAIYGYMQDENFRKIYHQYPDAVAICFGFPLIYFPWLMVMFDFFEPALRTGLSRLTGIPIRLKEITIDGHSSKTAWHTENAGLRGLMLELLQPCFVCVVIFGPITILALYAFWRMSGETLLSAVR